MRRGLIWLLHVLVIGLVAVAAGLVWAGIRYAEFANQPLLDDTAHRDIVIERGTSYTGMVEQLRRVGITEADWQWRVLGLVHGTAIQAGEYRIVPGLKPRELLARMRSGEVLRHELTIIEGWRLQQLLALLRNTQRLRQVVSGLEPARIREHLQLAEFAADAPGLEGLFLPDTYTYRRGDSDLEMLQRAHDAMAATLEQAWEQRRPGLPLDSRYELLILASIVEKETALVAERPRIAGVFVRRLQRGMRLQTDPTVIYGLGERFDGNLRRRDLREDTAYNTYTRHGLPPTPIALPGAGTIRDSARPAPGDALYFVASGDGGHVFSTSLEQHNRAVDRYQRGAGDDGEPQ